MNEERQPLLTTLTLLAAASLTLLSGCAGAQVAVYRMPEAHADLREDYSDPLEPAASKVDRDLTLSVASRPSLACSMAAAVGDGSGCVGLSAVDESAEKDETRKELMGGQPGFSWVLHDFGPTLATILEERLGQRFRRVTVTVDAKPRGDALAVTASVERMIVPVKITLTVGEGPGKIQATGQSTHTWSRGHLGWALPVSLITFPISLVWVPPILRSIQEKHEKIAIADALDHAAQALAEKLAARP